MGRVTKPTPTIALALLAPLAFVACGPDAVVGGGGGGGGPVGGPDAAVADGGGSLDGAGGGADAPSDIGWIIPEDLGPPPVYESCDEPPPAEWTWANQLCLLGPPAEVPAHGPLELALERHIPTSLAAHSTPIVAYLADDDGDGTLGPPGDAPRLLVVLTHEPTSKGAELWVFHGESGSLQWSEQGVAAASTPAVADLDGDGSPEVLVALQAGALAALRHDGKPWWSTPLNHLPYPWYRPHPAVSDMDGDGCPEIVLGAAIFDCQGALRWEGEDAAQGVIADLDLDGVEEAVYGHLAVGPYGQVLWTFPDALTSPQAPNSPAVANFDDDPEAEVLVSPLRKVRLHDHDGTLLWYLDLGEADPRESGAPVIADFDRDGRVEAAIAYRDVLLALNHDGSILWSQPVDDPSTGSLASAHDFDDDGYVELLYGDHARFQIFSGATGEVRYTFEEHVSNTFWEYPLVADVDGDGAAELLLPDISGVRVFGSGGAAWRGARTTWNQHAYAVTHIAEDGSVPLQAIPNFLLWNTFRASAPTAVPEITDLRPELITVCEQDCGGGLMRVRVRLHNSGTTDLPAGLRIALYSPQGGILSVRQTDEPIPALHTTPTLELLFKRADAGDGPLLLSADDDGKGGEQVAECDEENNRLIVQGPFCDAE